MTKKNADPLLKPCEVAEMFAVDPKTVTRWAQKGLIPSIMTPGKHRRYRESAIKALLEEKYEPALNSD